MINLAFLLQIKIYLLCNLYRVYSDNIVVCSAASALTAVGSLIVDAFGVFILILPRIKLTTHISTVTV